MLERTVPTGDIGHLGPDLCAAGIGNVYKSEVCFRHRVDPFTPVRDLDAETRRALYDTAARLLRANLTTARRVTVDDVGLRGCRGPHRDHRAISRSRVER